MQSTLLPTQFLLYGNDGYDSHVVSFLLEEKALSYEFVVKDSADDELAHLNPYKTLPILLNKELALYEFWVIFEYLEERHQANRLLPATPKERALVRTLAHRIDKDWLQLGKILLTHPDSFDPHQAKIAQKTLSDTLTTIAPLFAKQPFFLSETVTLCDILLAPFFWRLPKMNIHLSPHLCRPLIEYQKRLFAKPTFQKTLTHFELTGE